jgi:hypothetical protein
MLCVVVMGWSAASQQPPAVGLAVSGVARDQTGAVLSGASVELMNGATVVATAVTEANGRFGSKACHAAPMTSGFTLLAFGTRPSR